MLPTSAGGVEPATSWSPVGHASNWVTEAGKAVLDASKYLDASKSSKMYLLV